MSMEISRMCAAISPSPTLAIDAKAKEMRAGGRDVVSFCAGEPDFITPAYIRDAAHEALDMGLTKYTPASGTMDLRRAICDKLLRDNGLEYQPQQIVVSNGAKHSLFNTFQALLDEGIDTIFYPCMSYNLDEQMGDNHYNCPVVAYYPEVIGANVTQMQRVRYINDYVGLHRRKDFPSHMHKILCKYFVDIGLRDVKEASDAAYAEYGAYMAKIRAKGEEYLALAKEKNMPVIVLSGRPYHLDPEVNHGIDTLICDLGAVVVSEDSISHLAEKFPVKVLNQWTYHSRLYAAAKLVGEWNDPRINLVQLVSFGCGVDAITTDEVRRILEEKERIYTQIKIDEITNLGAVKIRLRSLFAYLEANKLAKEKKTR